MHRSRYALYISFLLLLTASVFLWTVSRSVQSIWPGVPPPPQSADIGTVLALSDPQLAYRIAGLQFQILGDEGGRSTPLKDYDYNALERWFRIADIWDPSSDYMPMLAAYYYGAVQDPGALRHILAYLETAGSRPEGEKWRWLAHAVYLAQHGLEDHELALKLARKLAAVNNPDMPAWTRQMPAFILEAKGDKETAYAIMQSILISEAKNLHPNEVNFMRAYICEKLLNAAQAAQDPLCASPK